MPDLEKAVANFHACAKKDCEPESKKAVEELKKIAETKTNHPIVFKALSECYALGVGIDKNPGEAKRYYDQAKEHSIRADQEIKESKEQKQIQTLQALQRSFNEAKGTYNSEDRRPYGESKLVGHFGLFSRNRHGEYPRKYEQKLTSSQDDEEAICDCVQWLENEGSLWSLTLGYNHSFTNYFLTCLRQTSIQDYRNLIENTYGVKFIVGEIELYRCDARSPEVIFAEGFKLNEKWNIYSVRKIIYANPATGSLGVSFSKEKALFNYGPNCYRVRLPANHPFLLIDIEESPCNQFKTSFMKEVNSLDDIPGIYVKERIPNPLYGIHFWTVNKNFSQRTDTYQGPIRRRGCY